MFFCECSPVRQSFDKDFDKLASDFVENLVVRKDFDKFSSVIVENLDEMIVQQQKESRFPKKTALKLLDQQDYQRSIPYCEQITPNSCDAAKPLKTSSRDTPESSWPTQASNPA